MTRRTAPAADAVKAHRPPARREEPVIVAATDRASAFIREHGGRLYVWASTNVCCGGTRFIEASTDAPPEVDRFRRVQTGDFELFIRPAGDRGLPLALDVDVGRLLRNRVRAYWDGCPYLP